MGKLTFDEEGTKNEKEYYEWLNVWCEATTDESLPRVALIGDSITQQSYQVVKNELAGIANVDYLATSYSISSTTYNNFVKNFLNDSEYDVIYFNYGLHAYSVDINAYEKSYRELLEFFLKKSKVIIGLTTNVLDSKNLNEESAEWKDVVITRNQRATKLAQEFGLTVDDLFTISVSLGSNGRQADGVHFNAQGNSLIGKSKADKIKKILRSN